MRCLLSLIFVIAALAGVPGWAGPPDVVLVTLDTLRADELGCYGGAARTPNLDRLAAGGVRFARALSPVPLTLPAHASLLTGFDPNEHGLRDNNGGVLPHEATTIAESLSASGYATIAVVGSRVLDHRLGLDRGFDVYDDRMAAERVGEFGYAERPAREVVDAALREGRAVPEKRPLFLWVHFYDAHSPYEGAGTSERERYRSEIEAIDREIGRLLAALASMRADRPRWVIAVGDHGESFGENGEFEHGYLLHEATLAVPLIVQGPGLKPGTVLRAPVATVRLAATMAAVAGPPGSAAPSASPSPSGTSRPRVAGRPLELGRENEPLPVYHETEFPASTYGWSPLVAVSRGRWRLVVGPKPALFDLEADAAELANRLSAEPEVARELRKALRELERRPALHAGPAPRDADLAAALASLGYLSGASAKRGTLDPAEGLRLLPDFEVAKRKLAAGDLAGARADLRTLVRKSPYSVPFLSQLAYAEQRAGEFATARRTWELALAVNPANEFLLTGLAALELEAGQPEAAERAYREALAANPRHLPAWIGLGEMLSRAGRPADEERALRDAVAAHCDSAILHTRLARIGLARGELAAAEADGRRATELLPDWPVAWQVWAEVAARAGDETAARERAARARALAAN
ncbi:MAG: sulfatase-like hydrolase/transferase [Thermoanaerobaculia bacterium]